jgi:hypothetical protein
MRNTVSLCLLIALLAPAVAAQQGFWNPPVRVKEVSSTASDYYPQICGDNLTIRISSSRTDLPVPPPPAGGWHVWYAKRPDAHSTFSTPVFEPGAIQTSANDLAIWVMPDELWAYTSSNASLGGGVGGFDVWEWTRSSPTSLWTLNGNVTPVNSTSTDYMISVTRDHLEMYLYHGVLRAIAKSTRPSPTSAWGTAAAVTELAGFGHPAVSYDGLTMLTTNGSGQIHMSTRMLRTDLWGTPTSLTAVNQPGVTNNRPTLSADGRQIFFSCNGPGSSIWDVWMAQWVGLTTEGVPSVGASMKMHVAWPLRAGSAYQFAMSFYRTSGIPVPGVGTIPLDPDPLFWLSVSNALPTVFSNFNGFLDIYGEATATVNIPKIGALVGFPFSVGAVTYDASGITYIANGKDMQFNP